MSADWRPRPEAEIPDAQTAAEMARPEVDYSAIDALAGGDPQEARALRASVAVIARRTDDRSLRDLCLAVLRGQQSIRRLVEHHSFQQLVESSVDHLQQGLDQLDPETRENLLAGVDVHPLSEEAEFALMEGRALPEDPPATPR